MNENTQRPPSFEAAKKPESISSFKYDAPGGGSIAQNSDVSYDYTGQDVAYGLGDELSKIQSQRAGALFGGDLASALSTGRRIADLQGYLSAYRNGGAYSGPFGAVVPGARVKSMSSGSSHHAPDGGGYTHTTTTHG